MSYLAIARKYRPATFDEIVGQDHVTRTLRNAIDQNRIHHAFLFTGARGVGKTTAARALARSLNCANGPTADPCGTCTSCLEVRSGASPDLIEIDGASNNSVEDVREIREAVRYAPTGGGWKIYLIDEVHMLSKGAFNALLKTLEEPPPHVLFIFATTEPGRIPDTILSRVQRFDFKRIPVPIIVTRLQEIAKAESVTLTDTGLRMIARSGEGSMRDAQSLLDQVISYAGADIKDADVIECLGLIDRGLLYNMLRALLTGSPDGCLDCIQTAYSNGYDLVRFSEEMLDILRNATFVCLSEGARKHVDLPPEELTELLAITEGVKATQLSRLFSALLDVHDRVSRATRPKIVFEMSVAQLADIRPVQPLAALVERLESLEKRLSGGQPPPKRPGGTRPTPRQSAPSSQRGHSQTDSTPKAVANSGPTAVAVAQTRTAPSHLTLVVSPPDPVVAHESEPESVPLTDTKTQPSDRWPVFQARLTGVDPSIDALLAGAPEWSNSTLSIKCFAGRAAATAKRGLKRVEVSQALAEVYGDSAQIAVLSIRRPQSLTADERWIEEAKAHPVIAGLISELDAQIQNVVPYEDGEKS